MNDALLNQNNFVEHQISLARLNNQPNPYPAQLEVQITRRSNDTRSQKSTRRQLISKDNSKKEQEAKLKPNYIVKRLATHITTNSSAERIESTAKLETAIQNEKSENRLGIFLGKNSPKLSNNNESKQSTARKGKSSGGLVNSKTQTTLKEAMKSVASKKLAS